VIVATPYTAPSAVSDRRLTMRSPVACILSIAWIHHDEKVYPVEILDESDGGVLVELHQVPPNTVGRFVVVERLLDDMVLRLASIRHVETMSDECWRLGMEWIHHAP
jgi:hypothetical protein